MISSNATNAPTPSRRNSTEGTGLVYYDVRVECVLPVEESSPIQEEIKLGSEEVSPVEKIRQQGIIETSKEYCQEDFRRTMSESTMISSEASQDDVPSLLQERQRDIAEIRHQIEERERDIAEIRLQLEERQRDMAGCPELKVFSAELGTVTVVEEHKGGKAGCPEFKVSSTELGTLAELGTASLTEPLLNNDPRINNLPLRKIVEQL